MIITCGLIISTWTFPPPVGLVTPYLRRIQSKACCILSVSVHVEPLLICSLTADLWQSQRDHRPTLCSGGGGWFGHLGFGEQDRGANLCGSAKKVSEATSATCSPPSESTLPVREVRERDTGQFQESAVGYFYRDWRSAGAYLLAVCSEWCGPGLEWVIPYMHCAVCRQGGLSGWVKLPQLMFHFPVVAYVDGVISWV